MEEDEEIFLETKLILKLLGILILTVIITMALASHPFFLKADMLSPEILDDDITEDGYLDSAQVRYNTSDFIRTSNPAGAGLTYRGYAEWNISVIDDTANISKVYIKIKSYNSHNACDINQIEFQPSTASNLTLWVDIQNGTDYGSVPVSSANEINIIDLGSNAVTDLDNNLASDWFAIGFYNDTEPSDVRIFSEEGGYSPILIVYSDLGNYTFTFNGLYYENGNFSGSVELSAYDSEGTYIVDVNGSRQLGFDELPILFSFPINSHVRRIYAFENNETFYLFIPDEAYSNYEFDIDDYTGKSGEGAFYLESYRSINGTFRMIERMKVLDAVNDVPLTLVTAQTYRLLIRFADDSTYVFGFFVSGIDPTPILSITEMEFGEQSHTVYQYILAEATRPNATHVKMAYEDDTPDFDTIMVNFTVTLRNGSLFYNSSQSGSQSLVFNWYGADNETDYVVELWADHQYHGEIEQKWVLDYSRAFGTFPNLNALGTWPFPSKNIFSLIISLLVAGLFSFGSMTLAPFIFMTFLGAFTYIGATTFTYTQLAIGFSLSIIFALAYREIH